MAEWLISDIDDAVWERFKAKASAEGKSDEQLMRELIDDYVKDYRPRPGRRSPNPGSGPDL